jgi:hypothetical protein
VALGQLMIGIHNAWDSVIHPIVGSSDGNALNSEAYRFERFGE